MVSSNPYAPPQHDEFGGVSPQGSRGGVALSADVLFCDKGASLPPLCLFSGEPASTRVRRKLSWAPQWCLVLAAMSPLIGGIVYLLVRKTGDLEFSMSEAAQKRKTSGLLIAIGGGVGGFALGIGLLAADQGAVGAIVLVAALIAIVVGAVRAQLLRVVKIDKQQIQLKLRPEAAQSFARHLGVAR
ncbi:MAG TPA: hypothetical protein VEQ59_05330 [Polyangiaceae bacterium]|nr:hypothetical protein [Polyangiaceae bacterium]